MKKKSLTRRTFVKKTSIGAAGVTLTVNGMASLYANIIQDANKPALFGGNPVRPKGSGLGVSWPIYDDSDIQLYLDAYKSNIWSEYSNIISHCRITALQFKRQLEKLMKMGIDLILELKKEYHLE